DPIDPRCDAGDKGCLASYSAPAEDPMGRVRELLLPLLLPFGACGPGPPPPREDPVVLQPLLERLDRLVEALQTRGAAPSPTVTAAPGAAPSPANERVLAEPSAELLQRVEALERAVARLQVSAGAQRLEPPVELPRPKNLPAVAALVAQLSRDDEPRRTEARRSLFRLTEQQVLARLGLPDS